MDSNITSYLPRLLLDWYAARPHGEVHRHSRHAGTLLFADTSGFTALTRELAKQGKTGFEILTDLLNNLFQALEQVIDLHDGDIQKFSGDAIWCRFPPGIDTERVFAQMLYQVERLNQQNSICRKHPLSLHAGATAGAFDLITLGDAETRLEFEIVGPIVEETYRACDRATIGELAITLGSDRAATIPQAERSYQFVEPTPLPSETTMNVPRRTSELSDDAYRIVERYLPEAVRERKLEDGFETGVQSEHRQVTVLFLNLISLGGQDESTENQLRRINEAIRVVFESVDGYGGIVARIDPFTQGHKVLALFGALSKSGTDQLNALQAAERIIRSEVPNVTFRIGMSAGPLLCGEVGSRLRHEYTVMGNAVNMAARLMSKAPENAVLLDQSLHDLLQPLANLTSENVSLKGIGESVTVYRFESWRQAETKLQAAAELVGRDDVLELLLDLWMSRSGEQMRWVAIGGEVGSGRTALALTCARRYSLDRTIYLSGYGSGLYHAGWLIVQWLKAVSPRKDHQDSSLSDFVTEIRTEVDERWLPLFDQILGLPVGENEWTRGLSPELRLDKLVEIISGLLEQTPPDSMVILDDLESADSLTKTILARLVASPPAAGAMTILIDSETEWIPKSAGCEIVELTGLDAESLDEWLGMRFVGGVREKELIGLLIVRSEGNPLFIEETLEQLAAAGAIGHLTDESRWEVLRPLEEIKLADRLDDLQLSRLDALPESHRYVLKVASVIDDRFHFGLLEEITGHKDAELLQKVLQELVEREMLSYNQDADNYGFRRSLTRQAIYNCVPRSDLRRLHRAVGEQLLKAGEAGNLLKLAHHFSQGDDIAQAFAYSLKGAMLARTKNLLVEAATYFGRCGQILEAGEDTAIEPEARMEFAHEAADFALFEGNYKDAHLHLRQWRKLAEHLQKPDSRHAAINELANLLWRQSNYWRCRHVLNYLATMSETGASPSLLANSLVLLGELNRRTGKLPEAQASCLKAVELARCVDDRAAEANASNNLGLAYWSSGNLAAAKESFLRTLEITGANNSKFAEARLANNLAIISEEMGDYVEAQRLARTAKEIFLDIGDRRNLAYSSGNLANLFTGCGRYREALELYTAADRIFVRLKETHPHYYTVGNLGDLDLLLGSLDEARTKYEEVARFAVDSGDLELEAETTVRLAEHAYYSGDHERARHLYNEAIQKAEKVGSLEYQIRGMIGQSRFLIGERNVTDARVSIGKLSAFAETTGSDRTGFEAEFLAGELSRILGEIQPAFSHYVKCLEYATRQQQFELALKSLVRIAETQPEQREKACQQLGMLLDYFRANNGAAIFRQLMDSSYFQFFHDTMREALASARVATAP